MKSICSLVAVALLAGCAAPNMPGAGAGDRYTPVIDLQGVIPERYTADLDSCRSYARTINPAADMIAGALVGALVGAAVGASVGSGTRWQGGLTRYGAGYGATSGTLAAGDRAVNTQERIMTNCMAGRGYRTLDGSMPVAYYGPSPYGAAAAPVAMPQQAIVQAAYNPAQHPAPATIVVAPPVVAVASGVDAYNAERVAKDQSCSSQPRAALSAKGPGFESYNVPCANGDTIAIRCEFGNCRVLR